MSKLKVTDLPLFIQMLDSIMKIVSGDKQGCKFEVSDEKTKVNLLGEDQNRAFFETDALVADEDVSFCFVDISKLKRSLDLIKNIEQEDECEIVFTGTHLQYKNEVKWKLKCSTDSVIESFYTPAIKTELKPIFTFVTSEEKINQVLRCVSIVKDEDAKVYLFADNDRIIAEIDNKIEEYCNSVGLPISDEIDGEVNTTVCVTMNTFTLFKIIPSDEIEITLTEQNVIDLNSELEGDTATLKIRMVSPIVKR